MFLAVQSVHPPGTRGVVGYFGGFGTEAHKSGGLLRYRGAQGIGANKAHRGVGGWANKAHAQLDLRKSSKSLPPHCVHHLADFYILGPCSTLQTPLSIFCF